MSFVRNATRALDLEKRIRKTAESLDRLKQGALVALTGGTVALGMVGGGVFWLPAAMAGSLLAYRALHFLTSWPSWRQEQRLRMWDAVVARSRDLHRKSSLPEATIRVLEEPLNRELLVIAPSRMLPEKAEVTSRTT